MKEELDSFLNSKNNNSISKWASFNKAVSSVYGKPSKKIEVSQLKNIFKELSFSTQLLAMDWGLNNKYFIEEVVEEIKEKSLIENK